MISRLRATTNGAALAGLALLGCVTLMPICAMAQKNFDQPPQTSANPGRQGAPPADNSRFTLINNSGQNIDNLNISPPEDDSWGEDLMGVAALPPHNQLVVGPRQETGCVFDVRVVYHDHREEVLRRQNLCNLEDLTFTGSNARRPAARRG